MKDVLIGIDNNGRVTVITENTIAERCLLAASGLDIVTCTREEAAKLWKTNVDIELKVKA